MALTTIGLFKTNQPKECGIVQLKKNSIVEEIIEKPENPNGNLAFAGVIVASDEIFSYFQKDVFDIAKDLLPKLVNTNKLYGFIIQETIIDIGTPEGYKEANKEIGVEV